MLSYTLLTIAVKCFMLIFYIFYFNCDKFGSKGSFFFQNKRSKNIALKEEDSAQSCKQRGQCFPPAAFLAALSLLSNHRY